MTAALWSLLVGAALMGTGHANPPPLSAAHASLDNDAGCVRCHTEDNSAPNSKCLSCHKAIAVRVSRGRGYHARVSGRPCFSCHREHRGRGAGLINLNPATFDHNQTGWPLQGKHTDVRCSKCHTSSRGGGRSRSYLGAQPICSSCHADIHGFSRPVLKKCDTCHNVFGWRGMNANTGFNHNNTSYPLTGQHAGVGCRKCHAGGARFAPVAHEDCSSCHKDQHRGLFGARPCSGCHTTKGWKTMIFGHQVPRFRLTGRHRQVPCRKCHTSTNWQPPWKPSTTNCNGCHGKDNVHGAQFKGQPCSACHRPVGWKKLKFNHNAQSRFKLTGRHTRVACGSCHPGGRFKPLAMDCRSCHARDDPHQGKFSDKPCSNCHDPRAWDKVRFDHSITRFNLVGAHIEVDCEKCHPGGDTKVTIPSSCDGCHIDLHGGQFSDKLCGNCHSFDQWSIPSFPHNDISRFKLVGRHQEVDCDQCHLNGHFKPIQANCETCHRDFHDGQMGDKVCEQCHSPLGWGEVDFVHNRDSDYKLIGRHVALDCKKCHTRGEFADLPKDCYGCHLDHHEGAKGTKCGNCHTELSWQTNTAQVHVFGAYELAGEHSRLPCDTCHTNGRQQGGLGHECVGCHRDPHFASFGPFCIDCHSQRAWLPSTFRHFQTGFRLTGRHRFVSCDRCHVNRIFGGLPTDCVFCHTDTLQGVLSRPGGDFHSCLVSDCNTCHTTQGWERVRGAFRDADCRQGGVP